MDNGLVEIGSITTEATSDAIGRLKAILDLHRIYHIADGVTFFHPNVEVEPSGIIQSGTVRKVGVAEDRLRKCKKHLSGHFEFRKLIVPDLHHLNYISIIFLDFKEAEFLATFIHEAY